MQIWTPGMTMDDVELSVLKQALQFYKGNKTATAFALGLSVKTVYNKIEQFSLQAYCREDNEIVVQHEIGKAPVISINAEAPSSTAQVMGKKRAR